MSCSIKKTRGGLSVKWKVSGITDDNSLLRIIQRRGPKIEP